MPRGDGARDGEGAAGRCTPPPSALSSRRRYVAIFCTHLAFHVVTICTCAELNRSRFASAEAIPPDPHSCLYALLLVAFFPRCSSLHPTPRRCEKKHPATSQRGALLRRFSYYENLEAVVSEPRTRVFVPLLRDAPPTPHLPPFPSPSPLPRCVRLRLLCVVLAFLPTLFSLFHLHMIERISTIVMSSPESHEFFFSSSVSFYRPHAASDHQRARAPHPPLSPWCRNSLALQRCRDGPTLPDDKLGLLCSSPAAAAGLVRSGGGDGRQRNAGHAWNERPRGHRPRSTRKVGQRTRAGTRRLVSTISRCLAPSCVYASPGAENADHRTCVPYPLPISPSRPRDQLSFNAGRGKATAHSRLGLHSFAPLGPLSPLSPACQLASLALVVDLKPLLVGFLLLPHREPPQQTSTRALCLLQVLTKHHHASNLDRRGLPCVRSRLPKNGRTLVWALSDERQSRTADDNSNDAFLNKTSPPQSFSFFFPSFFPLCSTFFFCALPPPQPSPLPLRPSSPTRNSFPLRFTNKRSPYNP